MTYRRQVRAVRQGRAVSLARQETPTPNSVLLAQSQGEAPLDACPNGGVLVAFGVDTNAGELDEDEIQRQKSFVTVLMAAGSLVPLPTMTMAATR